MQPYLFMRCQDAMQVYFVINPTKYLWANDFSEELFLRISPLILPQIRPQIPTNFESNWFIYAFSYL